MLKLTSPSKNYAQAGETKTMVNNYMRMMKGVIKTNDNPKDKELERRLELAKLKKKKLTSQQVLSKMD